MSEATVAPEKAPTEDRQEFFQELQERFGPTAPSEEMIDTWKQSAGRVRIAGLNDDEVYIFRALKNAEYKSLVTSAYSGKQTNQAEGQVEQFLKERIVCQAVLWPKLDPAGLTDMYAGTVDALHTMIMQASNFVLPQEAVMLVREL